MMDRLNDISIVAGGWSFKKDKYLPGHVIAVNDAAYHLPVGDFKAIVSMDRLWTEYRWSALQEIQIPFWVRDSAVKNCEPKGLHWVHPFHCNDKNSDLHPLPNVLNGRNSGACAIQLAFKMFPRRLWLFGFDMGVGPKGNRYWYPDYPWLKDGAGTKEGKYQSWADDLGGLMRQFALAGVKVTQVGGSHSLHGTRFVHIGEWEWPTSQS